MRDDQLQMPFSIDASIHTRMSNIEIHYFIIHTMILCSRVNGAFASQQAHALYTSFLFNATFNIRIDAHHFEIIIGGFSQLH